MIYFSILYLVLGFLKIYKVHCSHFSQLTCFININSPDHRDKLEEQSRELERLRKQLSAKEEVERRQIDAVCQLNATNQRLEQAMKDVGAENAELEGKMSVLKDALESAYK